MNFPLDPKKNHISKNRLKRSRSAQNAGRILGFSTEICMNDMVKQ